MLQIFKFLYSKLFIKSNYTFRLFVLFLESNERLQSHLKERMHSLEEKNHLSNELERTKKKVEEAEQNKARLQSQLEAQNLEIYNLRLFGQQQQETTYNSADFRYAKNQWLL